MTSSKKRPQKAIIFARVSSKNQEEGYSLIAQVSRMQEYCKRNGLEVIYEFQLIETSTSADRAFFYNMLECINNQEEPIALVVDSVYRLQRSFKEIPIFEGLRMSGKLTLHFVKKIRSWIKNQTLLNLWLIRCLILWPQIIQLQLVITLKEALSTSFKTVNVSAKRLSDT